MSAPAGAFVIRNATVKIGATEYAQQFTKCRLVPSTNTVTLQTMVPEGVVQDTDTPVWTWQVTFAADWTITTGIASVLNAAAGTDLSVVMAPKLGGRNATFSIRAMPVDFGGDQGAFNTVDATFPVQGQPVFGTDDES